MTSVAPGSGGLRLFDSAQEILDAVVNAASANLIELPSKRYLTAGEAVYDCEQVSVTVLNQQTGFPSGDAAAVIQAGPGCDYAWSSFYEIGIVRCTPKISSRSGQQSPEALSAMLEILSKDTSILMDAIWTLAQNQIMTMSASIQQQPPSGGLVATTCQVVMTL